MEFQILILLLSFFLMLVLNVPIAVAIGMTTFLTVYSLGDIPTSYIVAQRMSTGIESFSLLAIPFFILAGVLMGEGGMAKRLIDFAAAVVGRFTGGLAYINTLTCMMFGSISGSAVAAVSSVGGFMIPEMERKGYGNAFSVAVTTTAATTGLIIPPSNIMIVYAVVAGQSVATMFMAGVLPGLLIGLCIMVVAGIISKMRGFGGGASFPASEVLMRFLHAVPSLFLIVIILVGILGIPGILDSIFTPTEASAVAVVYALFLGVVVYQEVKIRDLAGIFLKSGKTTAIVMLLIGTSQAMSWILAYENVPQNVSAALLALSDNPIVIFLIINLILLIVGTFMDMTPALLIFTPIFLPIVMKLGMHPVHFGVMMVANLCIGICTPPVGTCLFVGCGVGRTTIAKVTGTLIPFFIGMIVALMLISYIPWLSMWLPNLMQLG